MRRFLQHVLPRGFVTIRHYGLLANRQREQKLAVCRRLLLPQTAAAALAPPSTSAEQVQLALPPHCPNCGGSRLVRMELPKEGADDSLPQVDTS